VFNLSLKEHWLLYIIASIDVFTNLQYMKGGGEKLFSRTAFKAFSGMSVARIKVRIKREFFYEWIEKKSLKRKIAELTTFPDFQY